MRPDDQTIQQFREVDGIISSNLDSILKDFETVQFDFAGLTTHQSQELVNFCFSSYVLGIISAIIPTSELNLGQCRNKFPI